MLPLANVSQIRTAGSVWLTSFFRDLDSLWCRGGHPPCLLLLRGPPSCRRPPELPHRPSQPWTSLGAATPTQIAALAPAKSKPWAVKLMRSTLQPSGCGSRHVILHSRRLLGVLPLSPLRLQRLHLQSQPYNWSDCDASRYSSEHNCSHTISHTPHLFQVLIPTQSTPFAPTPMPC